MQPTIDNPTGEKGGPGWVACEDCVWDPRRKAPRDNRGERGARKHWWGARVQRPRHNHNVAVGRTPCSQQMRMPTGRRVENNHGAQRKKNSGHVQTQRQSNLTHSLFLPSPPSLCDVGLGDDLSQLEEALCMLPEHAGSNQRVARHCAHVEVN